MSGGRVQQIATPRALYDRPANRFVAGFIGESSFLAAEGLGGALRFQDQTLALAEAPSGPVTLMVRPEHVVFGGPLPEALNLAATVTDQVYFGTDTHVYLALDGGAPLVARVQNALRGGVSFAMGQRVTLALPADALRVMEG
jgi:spermidine/putrescine transport system ATP-binding protein